MRVRATCGRLFVWSLSCLLASAAWAADGPLVQIQQSNEALTDVLSARVALAQFEFEQICALRKQGHASWLEEARQATVVESIREQQRAVQKFSAFVRHLQGLLPQSAAPSSHHELWQVYLPQSVRLVGWITPATASPVHDGNAIAPATKSSDASELVAARLQKAEQRYASYSVSSHVPEAWRERAKLQLRVARAEQRLIEMQATTNAPTNRAEWLGARR